jgi:hypothetical protein
MDKLLFKENKIKYCIDKYGKNSFAKIIRETLGGGGCEQWNEGNAIFTC